MLHQDTSEYASSSIVSGQAGNADSSTGSGSGSTPMKTFQAGRKAPERAEIANRPNSGTVDGGKDKV